MKRFMVFRRHRSLTEWEFFRKEDAMSERGARVEAASVDPEFKVYRYVAIPCSLLWEQDNVPMTATR